MSVSSAETAINYSPDTLKKPSSLPTFDGARENVLRPGERVSDKVQKNLFVKVESNKTSCYVGEPIAAEYKLYSRLVAKSKIIKQPSLNGFTVFDMIDFVPLNESVETVQGKRFKVHTLRKTQLIPLQTGTLELDPIELENTVEFIKSKDVGTRKGNHLNDLLDVFLDEESAPAFIHSSKTKSTPLVLSVNPLPDDNRPSLFSGAVGQFTISATIDSSRLVEQHVAVLTVKISGKGSLALIDAPEIQWPPGIETMDPRTSEETDQTVIPLEGIKNFEYQIVPQKEGTYSIPPVSFAYFDPAGDTYKTISTAPVVVRVSWGEQIARPSEKPAPVVLPVQQNNSVPAFLKAHITLILVVLLALIGILFIWMQVLHRKVTEKQVKTVPGPPAKPVIAAGRTAHLQNAKALITDPHGFYTEINKVLLNTLSEKLNRSPVELYKSYIVQQLHLRGWSVNMTADLLSLLNECEKNLYSSDYIPSTDLTATLFRAERVLIDLQKI